MPFGVKFQQKITQPLLCEHMFVTICCTMKIATKSWYFLHFTDDLSTEQKSQAYAEKVNETPGIWNQDISDIVQMAVANLFNSKITIFLSRVNNSVINIEPTMGIPTDNQRQPSMLSYLAMRGFDHYARF